jgi:hypothetical protein
LGKERVARSAIELSEAAVSKDTDRVSEVVTELLDVMCDEVTWRVDTIIQYYDMRIEMNGWIPLYDQPYHLPVKIITADITRDFVGIEIMANIWSCVYMAMKSLGQDLMMSDREVFSFYNYDIDDVRELWGLKRIHR